MFQSWQHQKRSNSARLPSFFELNNVKNETILRDFLNFWTWQHPKRSNSARLFNLTTSKTKQFCESSSFFTRDNIKNKAILLPSRMESWLQRWRPRTNAFCDFSNPPVESTAPATKKWCQVIRSAAPITQNHFSKPTDLMLQNATPLRESAPWPPNISDEHGSWSKCLFPEVCKIRR